MKKRPTVLVVAIVVSMLLALSACASNKLSGTYTLDNSGVLGSIASAVGAFDSLSFSDEIVSVNVGGGMSWSGSYVLDESTIIITPEDGEIGLSGTLSEDKQVITIANLTYIKE